MQYMIKVASYVIIICLGHNFGSVQSKFYLCSDLGSIFFGEGDSLNIKPVLLHLTVQLILFLKQFLSFNMSTFDRPL